MKKEAQRTAGGVAASLSRKWEKAYKKRTKKARRQKDKKETRR